MIDLEITIKKDGAAWCAHRSNFTNLQESLAGFGDTPEDALADLMNAEAEAEANAQA